MFWVLLSTHDICFGWEKRKLFFCYALLNKDRSNAVLLLWIFCVIYVLCLSCFRVRSLLPCGHQLGKGWPLGSCLWCLIEFLSLSYVVTWVRCGTWLYRFLIFAAFLTLQFWNKIYAQETRLYWMNWKKQWSTSFCYSFKLTLLCLMICPTLIN